MATVLLLRHGRTAANAGGGLAGRSPIELDETGRAQAAALAPRLAGVPLVTAVTSPLPRCRQTVALAVPQAPVVVEERLIECGYGQWQGRPLAELAEDPLWPVVQQHPAAVTFPGPEGESMAAMSARAVAAVRHWDAQVTREHGPHAVWLACSHGDVIKAIVADALGLHLDLFQRLVIDPASVAAIRYTATRPFLLRLGDTGELRFDPPTPPASADRPGADAGAADASAGESDAPVGGGAGGGGFGRVEV
ncbi:MSMEG_4193 family putative phosphomutase [Natronosporangium hydrolyticum]|uniref:MSMEG_4193 family putative phosphomutase n=1 Tax=Natronosporangium hydrolyticum TaxID=2811111 RepID=UPI003B84724A